MTAGRMQSGGIDIFGIGREADYEKEEMDSIGSDVWIGVFYSMR